MYKADRLTGIDLCRGLAAFAVVLVHSGDKTWGVPISERAIQFTSLFNFAVPFFLAASFYFATTKSPLNISLDFWQKKFKRLAMPYLLWSAFYVILKSIIFLATNNNEKFFQLLADPIAIIFFGGASYHLYFIPLLFTGSLWLCSTNYLTRLQNSILFNSLFFVFSIIIYQLLLNSNNNFRLGLYIAFPSLLELMQTDSLSYSIWRIFLVNISFLLKCLPYFLMAKIINELFTKNNYKWLYKNSTTLLLFLIFLLVNIWVKKIIPSAASEIVIAYSLLLFGISISKHLKDDRLIKNLGICSFGIYLIHPFIKSVVEIILIKVLPQVTQSVSIISILVYSISSFIFSWIFISFMIKNKSFSQYI